MNTRPAVIVHTAAQPSHDRAAQIAFDDFDTNAVGRLNLLEAARRWRRSRPLFICRRIRYKVIGLTRWHWWRRKRAGTTPIPSTPWNSRELFDRPIAALLVRRIEGASDVMVQEYGRYFGMPTCALRGGCLTGPNHAGVELHGFFSYLIRCNLTGKEYKVFGYGGKKVCSNIHSHDVARVHVGIRPEAALRRGVQPWWGLRDFLCSILEAFAMGAEASGREQVWTYLESNRLGDHVCYYSDLEKDEDSLIWAAPTITKSLKIDGR